MRWLWIMTGSILLMSVWLVNRLLHLRKPTHLQYSRLKCSKSVLHLLRKAEKIRISSPETEALQNCGAQLAAHIRRIRRTLRAVPPLPADEDGHPRVMALAHDISDAGDLSPDTLLRTIAAWDGFLLTSNEIWLLPHAITAAQSKRLTSVLRTILSDARERQAAHRLFKRLRKVADPSHLLEKRPLSSAGLAALRDKCLHQENCKLLDTLDAWLEKQGITADTLAHLVHEQQSQFIMELHRALECFTTLERLDWRAHSENIDPLHNLLLQDPSETYPRLEEPSRHLLRVQVETCSRHMHLEAAAVVQQALALSRAAKGTTPEGCIAWYFQERAGMRCLHRSLPARKGVLWVRMQHRQDALAYAFLLIFGIITGFAFLQNRQPVFMLPFFSLVVGCISRALIRLLPRAALPQMTLPPLNDDLRLLIVMHAELQGPDDALQAVKQLHRASHILPRDVSFMLLADFAPSITAVSGSDHATIRAAADAIRALADSRFLYLQRSRVWDAARHCYCTGGGSSGALHDLCSWIARGEAAAPVTFATFEPASLERQYAYVFSLSSARPPMPGVLEALLGTLIHPLHSRVPTPEGWRGFSALSPEGMAFSDDMALIQPDVYLEATAGISSPGAHTWPLYAELAGHAAVPGVRMPPQPGSFSWADHYRTAHNAWMLARWQLPHVQTPSGLIANPLRRSSRFRLREKLRSTLVPLGRFTLLFWSVITKDWPLLLLSLLAPAHDHPVQRQNALYGVFCRLCLLPTSLTINLLAATDALLRKRHKQRDFASIEVWAQGIAATVFAALGLALPGGSMAALALGVLFACFPLAHKN